MKKTLITLKHNAAHVVVSLEQITAEAVKEYKADYTTDQIVDYVLGNHECGYTHCIEDACDSVEMFGIGRVVLAPILGIA